MKTLVDHLRLGAEQHPTEFAFNFLRDDRAEETITRAELWARVSSAAAEIRRFASAGDRVLIAYPPGFNFIVALLGCMHAGVVAVPVYPPALNQKLDRLESVVADSDPVVAIADGNVAETVTNPILSERLRRLPWIEANGRSGQSADYTRSDPHSLALLQYTSGSTGRPKGVMISTANLVANTRAIGNQFEASCEDRAVFWLPPYHDMGLIGGILTSLVYRVSTTLMSSSTFLRRPFRWLESISRISATVSGAPNFAYALCNSRVTDDSLDSLRLDSWKVAFCGAEPINAEVMRRFAERFSRCGFNRRAIYPCYGLAEATLMVTGSTRGSGMGTSVLDMRELVGCGRPSDEVDVRIVDPETRRQAPTGAVGEIWVRGPSVAMGYWGKVAETVETFQAKLEDGPGDQRFLRTGDLGFVKGDAEELFLTGRIKDIIIVAGRNLYPEDLEAAACQSHGLLNESRAAAFGTGEGIVLVHEVDRRTDPADLAIVRQAIIRALFDSHGISPYRIIFVRTNTIPLTTSGKVRRGECRNRFHEGSLEQADLVGQSS